MASGLGVTLLAGIGALFTAHLVIVAAQFLVYHLWTPAHPLKAYKRAGADAYALVTGGSAGIGLGIARALVQQGFGVILLGHIADELASAAKTLSAIRPRTTDPGAPTSSRVRTLVLDARKATPEQLSAAVDSISDLRISILVNNVGGIPIADPPLRPLATLSTAEVDAVIDVNARFVARWTNLVLPLLVSSRTSTGKQERSLILNLSSAGRVGLPWLVMYGATKAFDYAFSAGLARELEDDPATSHIDCLAVVPGEVQSQGNNMAEGSITSDAFGRAVVGGVDWAVWRKWREVRPHWPHDITTGMMDSWLPERVLTHFIREELRVKKQRWHAIMAKRR